MAQNVVMRFKIHLLIGLLNKDWRFDHRLPMSENPHFFDIHIAIFSIIICQLFVYDISGIITYKYVSKVML